MRLLAYTSLLPFQGSVLLSLLCPSSAAEFGAAPWNDRPPSLATDPLPCHNLSNPRVCVINASVTSSSSLELTFDGDVEVKGDDVALVSAGFVSITASGKVSFENTAGVTASEDIMLSGRNLDISSMLTAGGHVALGVWMPDDSCDSIHIRGPSIAGASLTIHCLNGTVGVSGTTITVAEEEQTGNGITMEARDINMDTTTRVQAHWLTVEAEGDLNLEAGRIIGLPSNGSTGVLNNFRAFARGHMALGSQNGHWTVRQLTVAAQNIVFAAAHTIETLDDVCQNQRSRRSERCSSALQAWPPEGQLSMPGASVDAIAAAVTDEDVTFDFVAVALEALQIKEGNRAYGSTMFLCAGGDGTIGELATLDASWRGCSAENGEGRGTTNNTKGAMCGAGGGSHLGLGGHGVQYGTLSAAACANPGLQYDMRRHPGFLPTQTASGGGCGVTKTPCDKEVGIYSHGGGLIWIEMQEQLSIQKGTQILADGNRGKQIAETANSSSTVSGGGAGGQIFLYAKTLRVPGDSSITVSVQGGAIMCSNFVAGGAGGGGFVGLGLLGDRKSSVTDGLNVNVDSGTFSEQCSKFNFPENFSHLVFGTAGLAISLTACDAGHAGIFCAACPLGRWNSEGGNSCYACSNKPERRAIYTMTGWTSPRCPYKCISGVPDVASNPYCLESWLYIFYFFGGANGLLLILGLLVLVIVFLLWRRAKFGIRSAQGTKAVASFHRPPAGTFKSVLFELCKRLEDALSIFSSDSCPDELLWFSKEQLPFHICRVFMCGNNSRLSPWGIAKEVPQNLEGLVVTERWALFVGEANALATVSRFQTLVRRLLLVIYPPAAPVYAAHCRRKRAKKLRRCVNAFSEGVGSRVSVWKPIRARGNAGNGTGVLAMAFGFDGGSTLGYVDFFDFSRSQLDWAPVDLQNEVRLLVAHGDGSYMEPFSLDASDPLLQHLGHMGFGEASVYGVVSVFNVYARFLRKDALSEGSSSPALVRLREAVDQCARKCGMDGVVHVLVVPQPSLKNRHGDSYAEPEIARTGNFSARSGHSFSDLLPSGWLSRQSSPMDAGMQRRMASPASSVGDFTFDALQIAPPYGGSPYGGSQRSAFRTSSLQQVNSGPRVEWKLCLAFSDRDHDDLVRHRRRSDSDFASSTVLISPMASANLSVNLAWSLEQADEARRQAQVPRITSTWSSCKQCIRSLPQRVGSLLLTSRRAARSGRKMATVASAILLLLIAIMFTDFLLFLLMWSLLYSMQGSFLFAWLLIPPFAQPLAFVIGPLTLFLELPRLGRLFAVVVAFGLTNALVTIFLLLVSIVDSLAFCLLGSLAVCIVKFALILCANAHISSLEAALDLSFIKTHQVDSVHQFVSGEVSTADNRFTSLISGRQAHHSAGGLHSIQSESIAGGGMFVRQGTNSTDSIYQEGMDFDMQPLPQKRSSRSGTFSLLIKSVSQSSTPGGSRTPEREAPESARAGMAMAVMSRKSPSAHVRSPHASDKRAPAPF